MNSCNDDRALRETVAALVGRTRAIVLELEAYHREIARAASDASTAPLLTALGVILADGRSAMTAVEPLTVGERVAEARRARGMSREVVAHLLGRSKSWLAKVESGERRLDRVSVIVELADILKVDVAEIIGPLYCAYSGSLRHLERTASAFVSMRGDRTDADEERQLLTRTRQGS